MSTKDEREEILKLLKELLVERPQAAVILAEILGLPPALREEPQSR